MTSEYEAPHYRFTVWRNTHGVTLQTNDPNTAMREYTRQCDNVDEIFRRWRRNDIVELREMGRDKFASHATPYHPADDYVSTATFRVHLDLQFMQVANAVSVPHIAQLLFRRSVERFVKSDELSNFCEKDANLTEYLQTDDLLRCVPNNVQLIHPAPVPSTR